MPGFDEEARARERTAEHGIEDLVVLHADQDVLLATCLNRLVDAASRDVAAKVDDASSTLGVGSTPPTASNSSKSVGRW